MIEIQYSVLTGAVGRIILVADPERFVENKWLWPLAMAVKAKSSLRMGRARISSSGENRVTWQAE